MDLESKRALLRCETAVRRHAIPTHTIVATIVTLPDCFSVSLRILIDWYRQITCVRYRRKPPFGYPSDSEMARKKVTMASLHYAVEVWEAVMVVAAPFVAGKLRSLHRAVLIEDRARCAGVEGKGSAQAPAVETALLALNAHIKAWAANLEAAAVMSPEEEAGFLILITTSHAAPPSAPLG